MLINKLLGLMIGSIAMVIVISLIVPIFDSLKKSETQFDQLSSTYLLRQRMTKLCAFQNTVLNSSNNLSVCLKTQKCKSGQSGPLNFFDEQNKEMTFNPQIVPPSPNGQFNSKLDPCDPLTEQCDFQLTANYTLSCSKACNEPDVRINFVFSPTGPNPMSKIPKFELTQQYKRVYSSCGNVTESGAKEDGLYFIDFDGIGGECPIELYCRVSDGIGSTLVANAPTNTYNELPTLDSTLTPENYGIYPEALIKKIAVKKKFSVEVRSSANGLLYLGMNMPSVDFNKYTINAVDCAVPNVYQNANFSSSSTIQLVDSLGISSVGFSHVTVGTTYQGFHCQTCNNQSICGLPKTACCESQLKGAVWAR